ncbi:translation initiation factor IF-3 [Myxococcota bacterium]|nr:translation initiation factor IF-3 [Myxococcota bacterium]
MAKPPQRRGNVRPEEPRVNRRIRSREIRVIDPEGRQLGIMPPELALGKAQDLGLDLVEVSSDSKPPVCRIMDYGKYKYEQKKKQAEAKKNQATVTVKEVKFRPKIEEHDYSFKVGRIRKFLQDGNKTKVTMMFRGREITHQGIALGIMNRIAEDIKEDGSVESRPKLDGRNMIMYVAPHAKQ